jgi:Fe-S cluster biogenesis protein NfuA
MQQSTHDQLRAERIEKLVQTVSAFSDPYIHETVQELLQILLDMYGEGLSHILELTAHAKVPGSELIKKFMEDELIVSLLLIHDLHPTDIKTRIQQALNEIRPYLQSHGGNVELLRVEEGVAYLRLDGSCHSCQPSDIILKQMVEEAIYKVAPDLDRLEVDDITSQPQGTSKPVTFIPTRRNHDSAHLLAQGQGSKDKR